MDFTQRIKGLLTSPDKTMEDIAKEPRIEEAIVFVACCAILGAIMAYLQTTHITYQYTDSSVPDMSSITTIMAIIGGLVWPFIAWIIITAVLYLFAMAFGGEGKFMSVLTALGNSYIVKIFAMVVAVVLLTQAPYVTVQVSSSNPFGALTGMSDYSRSAPVLLSSLVMLIGVIWSSVIGIFGIRHTEKISAKNAAIVVGLPLAIYVIIQLISIAL